MSSEFNRLISECLKYDFVLKSEQVKAINGLLSGQDTFCILPTGLGKSMIFTYLSVIQEKVKQVEKRVKLTIMIS